MSVRDRTLWATAFAVAILLTTAGFAEAQHSAGTNSAQMDTYVTADGEKYFALSLTPSTLVANDAVTDIVVLFDTSASQTGEYRTNALSSLDTMLSSVGPNDRVIATPPPDCIVPATAIEAVFALVSDHNVIHAVAKGAQIPTVL